MGETGGVIRLKKSLNPDAREFRPGNFANLPTVVVPPVRHVYYSLPPQIPPPINGLHSEPLQNMALTYSHNFPINFNPVFVNQAEEIEVPQVQHPSSCPTRSLLLSAVPGDVSESVVRRDLEGFGDVRGVQMERIRNGIVIVHYYDLRHAERAFREMRNQYSIREKQRNHHSWFIQNNFDTPPRLARALIGGCAVWADFVVPVSNATVPDGINQGTVVVFNLELDVSAATLKEIFERFGPVREFRETPLKKHQRFIEYFDVRHAAEAVKEMNGKDIHGKPVVVEFSRPGGHSGKFFNPMPPPPPPPRPRPSKLSAHRSFYSQAQFSSKNLQYMNGGGRSLNYTDKLADDKLQPWNCSGSTRNAMERRDSFAASRRTNVKKIINRQSPPSTKQETCSQPRINNGLRKSNFFKQSDSCFLISENAMEEDASDCRDTRTTVMIKNIPNKYSLKLLLKTLDQHCMECNEEIAKDDKNLPASSYDFAYLPIDFSNKCNVGYGFVNMTSPQGAWRLYKAFHLHSWKVFNSRKICQVTYARLQGLEALKEHFRNSKFPREMEQCELPVVFSPPRDGIQLTDPLAVAGNIAMHVDDGGHPSEAVVTAADAGESSDHPFEAVVTAADADESSEHPSEVVFTAVDADESSEHPSEAVVTAADADESSEAVLDGGGGDDGNEEEKDS